MPSLLHLLTAGALLAQPLTAIKVAANTMWIEHTPLRVAAADYYKGTFSIVSGGVASLFSDSSVDLGANAETQALRNFNAHRNLRTIYTVCEVTYRIVASKKKGIKTLADLKGKRIGGSAGTSSAAFIATLTATAGLKESDYTLVSGGSCMKDPCGSGTLPAMLKAGTIDAFGYWETSVQLGIDALGDDAIVFGNASIYREVFNLHTTAEKLKDPAKRKEIVAYIRALNQAEEVFDKEPEKLYERVSKWVGVTVPMLKKVWPGGPNGIHVFRGTLAPDLLDVLEEQDPWVAKADRRSAFSRATLAALVDGSVVAEAANTTGV